MDVVQQLLDGNEAYVASRHPDEGQLSAVPRLGLAVVACMDTRNAVEQVLGLQHGDAKIIRNAGNRVDDDTLRSLVVAVHLLGVRHIVIMGHTKCGMTLIGQGDKTIAEHVAKDTATSPDEASSDAFHQWLGGFTDTAAHVREGIQRLGEHRFMPQDLRITGLLFDNDTGRVTLVE